MATKKTNKTDTTKAQKAQKEKMEKMRHMAQLKKAEQKAKKKASFLKHLATEEAAGNVLYSCKKAGVTRAYMYECRAEDEVFAKAWDTAIVTGRQTLKDMALSVIYEQLKANDKTVAMFVLRQLEPETWNKDRERTGEGGGPIEMVHKMSPRFAKVMNELLGTKDGK